jgi:hypothetical protein
MPMPPIPSQYFVEIVFLWHVVQTLFAPSMIAMWILSQTQTLVSLLESGYNRPDINRTK